MKKLIAVLLLLPALALAQSTTVIPSDSIKSGCVLNADEAACVLALAGKSSAGFLVTATSSPTTITLKAEGSKDGTTYTGRRMQDADSGEAISVVPNASLAVGFSRTIILGGGDRYVRIRADTWGSGSVTVVVTATDTFPSTPWPIDSNYAATSSSKAVSTATSLTELIPVPSVSTKSHYITSIMASASAASTTSADAFFTLKYGTGSACGTGTTMLIPLAFNSANGGFVWTLPAGQAIKVPAGAAVCWIHSVAGSKVINVTYYTAD